MTRKLDPGLKSVVQAHKARASGDAPAGSGEPPRTTNLIVEFTGDLEDLKAVGFEPRSVIPHHKAGSTIATGSIPVDRLEDLAAIDHIVATEGPQGYAPQLDYSVPQIRADQVHAATPSRKGTGVVIGVIDSGIDWRHGAFVDWDDRTSRILAIWDQRLTPAAGPTPAESEKSPTGFTYGVEYLQAQLSPALNDSDLAKKIRTSDPNSAPNVGHGTHVAGIAAGNGAPATCCHRGDVYVGVAPGADIVFVRFGSVGELGESDLIVDALNYIFNTSPAKDRPTVINVSLGVNRGPHDGTTLVERTIDALVGAAPARAVVVAAGNHANERSHVQGSVPGAGPAAGQVDLEFSIREGHEYDAHLDLWYDEPGTLNLEVHPPGAPVIGPAPHGTDPAPVVVNPTAAADRRFRVDVKGDTTHAFGRVNNFRVRFIKPTKGNLPAGDWKLRLLNPNPGPVSFHCWIERGEKAPQFLPALPAGTPPDGKIRSTSDSTVSTPSTAVEAISVANHESRTGCCDCCPDTGIVESSGRGPVARGAAANRKPDIAAPGLEISAPNSDAANLKGNCCDCCPDSCCCLYQDMTGTSMAAPHVAGTIALMLEKNAALTKAEILAALQTSARERPTGGWDKTFGAGKLDAFAAVEGVALGPAPPTPPHHSLAVDEPLWTPTRKPTAPPERAPAALPPLPPALRILRARMNAIPEGELIASVISRHFSEVRRLINTNPRIATMWHRGHGPELLRRLVQGAVDPEAPPAMPSGTEREYLVRLFDLVARHGSSRLQAAVARYTPAVMDLLRVPLAARVEADRPVRE